MARLSSPPSDVQNKRGLRPTVNAAKMMDITKPHATQVGGSGTRNDNQAGSEGKSVKAKIPLKIKCTNLAGQAARNGEIVPSRTVGMATARRTTMAGIAIAFNPIPEIATRWNVIAMGSNKPI